MFCLVNDFDLVEKPEDMFSLLLFYMLNEHCKIREHVTCFIGAGHQSETWASYQRH